MEFKRVSYLFIYTIFHEILVYAYKYALFAPTFK